MIMWKMFAASTTSWTSRTIPPSTSTWQGCLVLLVIIILVLLIFIIIIQQIFGVHKWCLGTERRRTAARCQSQVWKPSSRSFSAGFSLLQNVQIKQQSSADLIIWHIDCKVWSDFSGSMCRETHVGRCALATRRLVGWRLDDDKDIAHFTAMC